jgi:BON domain
MIRRAWTMLIGSGLAAVSLSGEPVPVELPTPDWIVTLHARKALWNYPELADLNLGVRVRQGEALVWGPVLDDAQAAEAVARLRLVPGVESVVNEMFVLPANDILRRKFTPPAKPTATVTLGTKGEPSVKAIPSSAADLIEDVRRSDKRFFNYRVTFSQGIAEIEGDTDQTAATEFAARIRRLPGVTGVRFRPH